MKESNRQLWHVLPLTGQHVSSLQGAHQSSARPSLLTRKCSYFWFCVCVSVTHANKIFPLGLIWIGMSGLWKRKKPSWNMLINKTDEQLRMCHELDSLSYFLSYFEGFLLLCVALHFLLAFSHSLLFIFCMVYNQKTSFGWEKTVRCRNKA